MEMLHNLGDDLKKIVLLGIGAVAKTAEKCCDAKEIVDELVKKGELTVEQGRILNEELKHTVKEKVNETVNAKKEELMEVKLASMSKEDIELLKAKLAALEKEEACECDEEE